MTLMADPSTKPITADKLWAMGDDMGRSELIHGELIMMSPAGADHGMIGARLIRFIGTHAEDHRLGYVFNSDTGFQIDTDPDTVRSPDVAFVRTERVRGKLPRTFFDGAPDLAVEVRSPGDSLRDVMDKINMWLARGTTSVWLVESSTMTIRIFRTGRKPVRLSIKDTIRNEPALPGFELPLKRVFQLP